MRPDEAELTEVHEKTSNCITICEPLSPRDVKRYNTLPKNICKAESREKQEYLKSKCREDRYQSLAKTQKQLQMLLLIPHRIVYHRLVGLRRTSIGSDMKRRFEPLTPPRRVSAPLETLLAQCCIKQAGRCNMLTPTNNYLVQANQGNIEILGKSKASKRSPTTCPWDLRCHL
jgi:hypothetical protein